MNGHVLSPSKLETCAQASECDITDGRVEQLSCNTCDRNAPAAFDARITADQTVFEPKYRPLLAPPLPGQTKFDQILEWARKQL